MMSAQKLSVIRPFDAACRARVSRSKGRCLFVAVSLALSLWNCARDDSHDKMRPVTGPPPEVLKAALERVPAGPTTTSRHVIGRGHEETLLNAVAPFKPETPIIDGWSMGDIRIERNHVRFFIDRDESDDQARVELYHAKEPFPEETRLLGANDCVRVVIPESADAGVDPAATKLAANLLAENAALCGIWRARDLEPEEPRNPFFVGNEGNRWELTAEGEWIQRDDYRRPDEPVFHPAQPREEHASAEPTPPPWYPFSPTQLTAMDHHKEDWIWLKTWARAGAAWVSVPGNLLGCMAFILLVMLLAGGRPSRLRQRHDAPTSRER